LHQLGVALQMVRRKLAWWQGFEGASSLFVMMEGLLASDNIKTLVDHLLARTEVFLGPEVAPKVCPRHGFIARIQLVKSCGTGSRAM
jgi:hypothetical protein